MLGALKLAIVSSRTMATVVGATALGAVVAATPQLLAWRLMAGAWVVNGYSEEIAFTWLSPHLDGVVALLAKWLPVIVIALFGTLVLAFRRRDAIVAATVAAWLGTLYVTASWWAYGIAPRVAFDNLAPIALGLAGVAAFVGRFRRGAELILVAVLALWNVPFMMLPASPYAGLVNLLLEWFKGLRLLL
jgi:hypothetical protein